MISMIISCIFILVVVGSLTGCIVITKNKQVKIIEQFGRYVGYKKPGLSLKLPTPIQTVAKIIDMNIMEIQLNELTVKTKDNLFINFPVSIQVQVCDPEKAAYELDSPREQIIGYLSNFIRTEAPQYNYHELYGIKSELKTKIDETLGPKLKGFGFTIYDILVNEPIPSESVKRSYDKVNESIRELEAAKNNAEAEKVKIINKAQAEAESKRLQGMGIAQQRIEINKGLQESIQQMSEQLGVDNEKCLNFLIEINKLDTFRDISTNKGSLIVMDTNKTEQQSMTPVLLKEMLKNIQNTDK